MTSYFHVANCSGGIAVWIVIGLVIALVRWFKKQEREQEDDNQWREDYPRRAPPAARVPTAQPEPIALPPPPSSPEFSSDSEPGPAPVASLGHLAGRRILVADGSRTIQKMISMILMTEGCGVQTGINNGSQAWTEILETPWDLVLAEDDLPEIDGYQLCHQIKCEPGTRHMAVVILSNKQDADQERAESVGAAGLLIKPFNSEDLLEIVNSSLEQINTSRDGSESICPVCDHSIEDPPGPQLCPTCQVPHHSECWQLNDGCGVCGHKI